MKKKQFRFHTVIYSVCAAAILAGIFFTLHIRQLQTEQHADAVRQELSDRLLRFRVLANSDSTADQRQKNELSAAIASRLRPVLSACASKEDAKETLLQMLPDLEQEAASLAAAYGNAYPVTCSLGVHTFPLKQYQSLTFPAGTYDTFLITIGSGSGSNWWCLAYPPLCFAGESCVTVPKQSEQALNDLLSEDAWDMISGNSDAIRSDSDNGSSISSIPGNGDFGNSAVNNRTAAAADRSDEEKSGENNQQPRFYFRLLPFLNDWFGLS